MRPTRRWPRALECEALAQSLDTHTDDVRKALGASAGRPPPGFAGR